MLYHLLWSIVMDGPVAWKVQEAQLGKRLRKESIDLTTCWWMVPPCGWWWTSQPEAKPLLFDQLPPAEPEQAIRDD